MKYLILIKRDLKKKYNIPVKLAQQDKSRILTNLESTEVYLKISHLETSNRLTKTPETSAHPEQTLASISLESQWINQPIKTHKLTLTLLTKSFKKSTPKSHKMEQRLFRNMSKSIQATRKKSLMQWLPKQCLTYHPFSLLFQLRSILAMEELNTYPTILSNRRKKIIKDAKNKKESRIHSRLKIF